MKTKDIPLNMPCSDPEGCKHFKDVMKLEAKNRNLRMDVKLWKNRTTEAAKAVEDFEELEAENKQLRSIKCPPISDGDSCICPIEQLETTIKNACDLINDEGRVIKWEILNILNPAKGK